MIDPINDPTGRKAFWAARAAMLRDAGLKKGMQVVSATYGHEATVIRLNAKTVTR